MPRSPEAAQIVQILQKPFAAYLHRLSFRFVRLLPKLHRTGMSIRCFAVVLPVTLT
jgi:hypothetical protein